MNDFIHFSKGCRSITVLLLNFPFNAFHSGEEASGMNKKINTP